MSLTVGGKQIDSPRPSYLSLRSFEFERREPRKAITQLLKALHMEKQFKTVDLSPIYGQMLKGGYQFTPLKRSRTIWDLLDR